jgi:cytochrome c
MKMKLFGAAFCAAVSLSGPRIVGAAEQKASGPAQAESGAKLYGAHCAKCHGDNGEGTKKAPAVVGKNALPLDPPANAKKRKGQFRTAMDVAAFVVKEMPGNKPGSLEPEEYFQILAFALKANGVDVSGKTIDAESAKKIVLHP